MDSILVTGAAGSLARLTAMELAGRGHPVVGVDYRSKPDDFPGSIPFYQANYNKTRIEDVFRRHRPSVVMHLGRVGNLRVSSNKRFDLNVVGSAKIQELSVKYKVRRLVVLSTFHIYGAHPNNHTSIQEDEPLRAFQTIPKLSDAIQIDNQAVTWTYRYRELSTVVLRPTNVIGAHIRNTMSNYLRQRHLIYVTGYNPMWQFIDECDMLRALLAAMDSDVVGVFNVTGLGWLPIVEALKLTGARVTGVPAPLIKLWQRLRPEARSRFPRYLVDFFQYPCMVSGRRFREQFDYEGRVTAPQAIRSCVQRMPLQPVLA